ncbi:hypothetical protein ID10_08760 [Pantoea agglomerans]|uniref:hypothetical protein n=1 Tax=Enterobacter agglomerans TaxID=549 RepID=UPI00050FE5DF|nr:hypothetical protein [Pantoea agglomerans]KGD79782.1 hypothetical protein ID10_08760 [Pantoea agglomerans]
MKKLTAEKCCQLLDSLNSNGMSILEGYYVEALEIALPILEQQERGEGEWIHWNGGECPVNSQSIVDVRYRIGNEDSSCIAGALWWGRYPSRESHADIIAYRITPEQPTNQNGEQ